MCKVKITFSPDIYNSSCDINPRIVNTKQNVLNLEHVVYVK